MVTRNMIRWTSILAVAVLLVLAYSPPAAAEGNPRATGGGTTLEGDEKTTFVFNAVLHKGKGGSVNGHLVYHFRAADISIEMTLDCLRIVGSYAAMSGTVTKVTGPAPAFIFVGQKAVFGVLDNGEGADAPSDSISDLFLFGAANCALQSPPPYLPIDGNIQVSE